MKAKYISHVGAVRKNNEDAIYCDPNDGVFVIADGMGGHDSGEVASATAVRILAEHSWEDKESESEPELMLREAFYAANDLLYRQRGESASGPRRKMGTTMTAAVCRGDELTLAHVGDSRAYLINAQGITQLTQDHNLTGEMVREGAITGDQALHHPSRNILTRALGQETLVQVDTIKTNWARGDYLLLCTDGLYTLVSPEEMQEFLFETSLLSTALEFMVDTAYRRGGHDNISVLVAAHD